MKKHILAFLLFMILLLPLLIACSKGNNDDTPTDANITSISEVESTTETTKEPMPTPTTESTAFDSEIYFTEDTSTSTFDSMQSTNITTNDNFIDTPETYEDFETSITVLKATFYESLEKEKIDFF